MSRSKSMDAIEAAQELRRDRYHSAAVVFLAGSIVRGDATPTSDLDLVVVQAAPIRAYREALYHRGWPVEAFVHDRHTLEYVFRHVDGPTGVPSLATMVSEGVELPESSAAGTDLKRFADRVLAAGPPPWSRRQIDDSRYAITDLIEDLKGARGRDEAMAILSRLYPALADHVLRSRSLWSAKGKCIPRVLRAHDAAFERRFSAAFEDAFSRGASTSVIDLAVEFLRDDGGLLFAGYRRDAPETWRMTSDEAGSSD